MCLSTLTSSYACQPVHGTRAFLVTPKSSLPLPPASVSTFNQAIPKTSLQPAPSSDPALSHRTLTDPLARSHPSATQPQTINLPPVLQERPQISEVTRPCHLGESLTSRMPHSVSKGPIFPVTSDACFQASVSWHGLFFLCLQPLSPFTWLTSTHP